MRYSWENYYNFHSIFKLSYSEKKKSLSKKFKKKGRKEGDRIHVKY